MSGKAARILVTEKQKAILEQIVNAATATVRHAQRARIIFEAFQEKLNRDIAAGVGLDQGQTGLWRRRWADSFEALIAIYTMPVLVFVLLVLCLLIGDFGYSNRFSRFQRGDAL